jgi:DNA-binding NtrC family response regulator
MIRLLLYSDDNKLPPLLSAALAPECHVVAESSQPRLKRLLAEGAFDVLIVDLDGGGQPNAELLARYDDVRDCHAPVIGMTTDSRRSRAVELLQRGAYDCVRKPPSLVELKVVVRRACEYAAIRRELTAAREALRATAGCDRLIGSSGRAQVVYDLIRRVADLNVSVLIRGESGTGKELVARAIHNLGKRPKEPFVAVSCGAIPESLIEAELFGHERGAFTGAAGPRTGYFHQAGEGTLLLDEIGELTLQTQVKLLRVLQQREFTPLGGSRLIPLKARVLFATHRNLEEMVAAGTFRRDLFFRVNVMNIPVPPLRERTEDIPPLARHFLHKYSAAYEKPVIDIVPDAMELLVEHDWPGNIRELENVIQGAIIRADGDSISRAELPPEIQEIAGEQPVAMESDTFVELMRQYKIRLANRAVQDCQGNKSLAARKLGVSRAYLHRLIRMAPDDIDEDIAKLA